MNKVRFKIRHYIRVLYETKLKIKDKIYGKLNLEEIINNDDKLKNNLSM